VCCYVLCDVVDLAIHCNPAIVTVLVMRNVGQSPGTAQLAQLQGDKQTSRRVVKTSELHGRVGHEHVIKPIMGWAHWLGSGGSLQVAPCCYILRCSNMLLWLAEQSFDRCQGGLAVMCCECNVAGGIRA
jgi:hypothetical protein